MRHLTFLAFLAAFAGSVFFGHPASAMPNAAGAAATGGMVQKTDNLLKTEVYHRRYGRGHYRHHRGYRHGYYRTGYYGGPRVVCRVRYRVVATPYGYARRPVRICHRRW